MPGDPIGSVFQLSTNVIYIGTSGYSYDDWRGFFYPESLDKRDMLGYYAQRFPDVEVNSTYYSLPSAQMLAAMSRKTPAEFKFVVKAHKDITHSEETSREAALALTEALKPLQDDGKLGCVLAQYPWSFKNTPFNGDRLGQLKELMGDVPTVVEFRNVGWVREETFAYMKDIGLGYCCVDEPRLKGLMPGTAITTSPVGYIRFHGRNAQDWWQHEEAWMRYNYLYTQNELAEWVPKAKQVAEASEQSYIFFNNHYQGKSAKNARMFARMLNVSLPLGDEDGVDG